MPASAWLRENAGQLRLVGQDIWWALVHIIVGMIIGAMIAISHEAGEAETGPLVQALRERACLLGAAFRSVVFAQIRISALNTALTGLYLLGLVPLLGVQASSDEDFDCGDLRSRTSAGDWQPDLQHRDRHR